MEIQIQRNYYFTMFYTKPRCSRPFLTPVFYPIGPLSITHTSNQESSEFFKKNVDSMATAAVGKELQRPVKAQRREPLILLRVVRKKSQEEAISEQSLKG